MKEIKIIALHDVLEGTPESRLRSVYRWYSKTFATPLHQVPELPFTMVLQAYFEDQFENLDEEELEVERKLLTETETQRLERIAQEEATARSEADFLAMANAEAKRLESTRVPEQGAVRPIQHPHKKAGEAELPEPQAIPPNVSVSFVEPGFFEELMDDLDNKG